MQDHIPTAVVLTLGCKVNQYEASGMAEDLVRAGYRMVAANDPADLTVINTCTVTHKADLEVRTMIRRAHRNNPHGRCVVTGCYAQVAPEAFADLPGVVLILGQADKQNLIELLAEAGHAPEPLVRISPLHAGIAVPTLGYPRSQRTRVFFRIQDGCSACCAYCIIPQTRGPSRSLPLEDVLEGLRVYADAGYREIVLCGIHLGAWGLDLTPPDSLTGLLAGIVKESFDLRVRLSSIEPNEISGELIDLLRSDSRFCPHLHLPLQSGDDRVLARMRRPYRADRFESLVSGLVEGWPELNVGADVLVGFPGEGEDAFKRTRDLIERLPLAYLHVFRYSKRPGTEAAMLPDQAPGHAVKTRAWILRNLSRTKRQAFFVRQQNQVRPALIENTPDRATGLTRGLTDNYIQVLLPEANPPGGAIVPVRLIEPGPGNKMIGRVAM